MAIKIFQIDAFTNAVFGGNPAAVCPLKQWLPDAVLQKTALENNLPETAFFVQTHTNRYHLRWFTPEIEMDLCGHATLASAHVLFEHLGYKEDAIYFDTLSGLLKVQKTKGLLEMELPARPPVQAELPEIIRKGLNLQPAEVWKARDYVLLYHSEEAIRNMAPDIAIINRINLDPGGIIVTATGENADFVSRFFTPQASIFEDPVTGSAHCSLVPFWASRLGKNKLHALQLSKRGGELFCRYKGNSVFISGKAVTYLQGEIHILS